MTPRTSMVGMRRSKSQSPAEVRKFSQAVLFCVFVFQYLLLYFYICVFCFFVFNQGDQGRQIRIRISKCKLKSDSVSDSEFCSESASWSRVNWSHENANAFMHPIKQYNAVKDYNDWLLVCICNCRAKSSGRGMVWLLWDMVVEMAWSCHYCRPVLTIEHIITKAAQSKTKRKVWACFGNCITAA